MPSPVLRRRAATAVGIYGGAVLGLLSMVVAARLLGDEDFGLLWTVLYVVGFLQILLDLTVEEALVKFGFRYSAAQDYGRLRRLFSRALVLKVAGGTLAAFALVAAGIVCALLGSELALPFVIAAAIPIVQGPESVASAALMLRGRTDLRGLSLLFSTALRLAGVAIGAQYGVWQTLVGIVVAQAIASGSVAIAGWLAFKRFPAVPAVSLGEDRRPLRNFMIQSSIATGIVSLRTYLPGIIVGLVSPAVQVGFFRIAQAPLVAFSTLSAPARMILLTEQTRDWEHGRKQEVFRSVRRYTLGSLALMIVLVPLLWWLMPDLIELIYGKEFAGATEAAQVILLAGALQLIVGWTKSFPVSIGRPGLRVLTHGIESAVLIPLVLVLAWFWDATGAAVAVLISTAVFVLVWTGLYASIRRQEESTP